MKFPVIIILFIIERLSISTCSVGDRSPFYQKCVYTCVGQNCLEGHQVLDQTVQAGNKVLIAWRTLFKNLPRHVLNITTQCGTAPCLSPGNISWLNLNLPCNLKVHDILVRNDFIQNGALFSSNPSIQQDVWSGMLQWSCRDECCYHCMWRTVARFQEAGYEEPKFHGKWAFVRVLGVQEPASVLCSLLNLAANAYMYAKLRREFPFNSSALAMFWHVFAFVCMNAWVWSAVFHTRDKPLTEFMDYTCALSMVMALFVAAVVRVFHRRRRVSAVLLAGALFYFAAHVRYLYAGRVDYDYNMKVNVAFGVAGSALWLAWSWRQAAAGRRHARAVLAFTALNGGALALELLDFPPLWRAWDAHALWHLATAPLPLLFYKFVLDDLRLLQSSQYEKLDIKQT